MPWLVRNGAWTHSRFKDQDDNSTAYYALFGHEYNSLIIPIGEVVVGLMPMLEDNQYKGAQRMVKGIWVGRKEVGRKEVGRGLLQLCEAPCARGAT